MSSRLDDIGNPASADNFTGSRCQNQSANSCWLCYVAVARLGAHRMTERDEEFSGKASGGNSK